MRRLPSFFVFIGIAVFMFMSTGCSQKAKVITKQKATKFTSVARHKATMRSYKVLGKRYYPISVETGQVMQGISSWYGPNFHGKHTSNGEVYDMHARTAAHKTWPMDTIVKVTNKVNRKSTIVRINDRGPFVRGRIIDCSYKAGKEIGLDTLGIAKVKIEVLGVAGKKNRRKTRKRRKIISSNILNKGNYAVQVGAFSMKSGAEETKRKYASMYSQYRPVLKHVVNAKGKLIYRVLLLGFNTEEEAKDFKYNNLLGTLSR